MPLFDEGQELIKFPKPDQAAVEASFFYAFVRG